jgi:hypothetical protein
MRSAPSKRSISPRRSGDDNVGFLAIAARSRSPISLQIALAWTWPI